MGFQAVRRGEDSFAHNDGAHRGLVLGAPPHGDHHGRIRLRLQQLALGRQKPGRVSMASHLKPDGVTLFCNDKNDLIANLSQYQIILKYFWIKLLM